MSMNFSTDQKFELVIISVAIIFRVAFFWFSYSARNFDLFSTISRPEGYYEIAVNMLAGHGFSGVTYGPPFPPESLRVPLYPFFIAVIIKLFGTYWAVIIPQIIIGSVLAVLAKRISYHALPDRRVAAGVGIFFAVEPLLLQLSSVALLTETVFLIIFFGFILTLFNYFDTENFFYLAISAFLLGLATLTRPVTQYLPVFIMVFIIWHFRKKLSWRAMRHAILFAIIFLVVISPWLYRNFRVFDNASLAVTSAHNLYLYFVPSILALENNTSYDEARKKFLVEENSTDLNKINLREANRFTRRSLEIIKSHPVGAIKLIFLTTVSFFTHDGYLGVLQDMGYLKIGAPIIPVYKIIQSPRSAISIMADIIKTPAIFVVLGRIFWVIVTFLAFFGMALSVKQMGLRSQIALPILIVAYFTLTAAVVGLGITARYRTPINVFMVLFALYSFFYLMELIHKKTDSTPPK